MFHREGEPTLEAQVANLSDEIAYNNHDLDDGLRSGMINLEQLKEVEIWQEAFEWVLSEWPKVDPRLQMHQTVRRLINMVVTDLVEQTQKNLQEKNIDNMEKVRSAKGPLVSFDGETQRKIKLLKKFLFKNLYRHHRVERMADKAERILTDLFETYRHNPKILPPEIYQALSEQEDVERMICDYIAGMTDRFALEEHQKLFDPHARV